MSKNPKGLKVSRRGFLKTGLAAGAMLAAPSVLKASVKGSDDRITILNTFPTLANEYWQGWDSGARTACQQLGLKYISQSYGDSVEKQLSQIEQARSLGVNAVLTFAQNAEIIKALCAAAKRSGLLIANAHSTAPWFAPCDPVYEGAYTLYSQPDNIRGVAAICQVLFDRIGGEGRVMYVAGMPGNFSADSRKAGVTLALSRNPKIQLVAEQNGGENRVSARPVVENLLTAHPDVKAIISYNADTAIAVLDVLRERGLSGKIFTVGIDATKEILGRIQSDPSALGTVDINAQFMTGYSVVTLYDALQGVKADPLEGMRYFDSALVDTPEAAAALVKLADPANPAPYDYKAMSRHLNRDKWSVQWGQEVIDPTDFWTRIDSMNASRPAGWKAPAPVLDSLKAGTLKKTNDVYRAHYKAGPIADVVAKTRTKKTVLGLGA